MRNYAQEAALQPEKPLLFGYNPFTAPKYAENARKSGKILKMWALRPGFRGFPNIYFHYKPYGPENSQDFEQWAPPYSAQVAPSTQDCYDHTHRPNTLLPMCAVR